MKSLLVNLVDRLYERWGDPELPPTSDPFGLILWEQVAYLGSDERRGEAFARLRNEIGLTPRAIAGASLTKLEEVARSGGAIAAADRAKRMQRSAKLVIDEWGEDPRRLLERPFEEAQQALKRFPMIGEPGAEKILMLAGKHPVLALESNGLRVLVRVGFGEQMSYAKTYRSVQNAITPQIRPDAPWLARAHFLLRLHGRNDCRRGSPACDRCPIRSDCAHGSGDR